MVPVRGLQPTVWSVAEEHRRNMMTAEAVQHGMARLSVTVQHRENERYQMQRGDQSHDSSEDKEEVHRLGGMRFMAPPLHTGSAKDDRKNSGSTSKGLYRGTPRTINTEEHREFSAHTVSANANRGNLQTPTMSYTARHGQHPFVGNASSASKGSTSATQQTVSSELLPHHKDSKMTYHDPLTVPITEEDEV